VENRKLKSKKADMLRSIAVNMQSGESVESVRKKKTRAAVGRIRRKGSGWNERVSRGDG